MCVRAKGVDERHLRRPAGERAEAQGMDLLPVIQFDYAYLSSVNEKGEQVRMGAILKTSTGNGTAWCNLVNVVTGWRLSESRTNMILVGELEFGWDDTLHQTNTLLELLVVSYKSEQCDD